VHWSPCSRPSESVHPSAAATAYLSLRTITIPSMDTSQESEHARPKVDQSAYNYTLSEAGTSYAGSMAGTEGYNRRTQEDEDAQTAVSTYSYRSDRDASKYLRQVDGRVSHSFLRYYPILICVGNRRSMR